MRLRKTLCLVLALLLLPGVLGACKGESGTTDPTATETTAATKGTEATTPSATEQDVSTEPPQLTSLTVDGGYSLDFRPDTKEYTVKIPSGRPRIPKVTATADGAQVTVYQATIPDGETEGTARIVAVKGKGTAEYKVTFVKTEELGYHIQYADVIHYTPKYTLKEGEKFRFRSSDSKKLFATSDGRVEAYDVSDTPVTVTALVNGEPVDTLTVDKIVKAPVNMFLIMGQSNAFGWHDVPPEYSDYYSYANTQRAASDRPAEGTCFCDDVQNGYDDYTFSGLYDLSAGRSGFSPALGKEWYAETGEKCLMLQSAIGSTPIETWVPDPSLKFFGLDCYAITVERFNYYKQLFAAPNAQFEMNRIYAFWLQGETGEEFVYDPGEFTWAFKHATPNYKYLGDWRGITSPDQLMTSQTYSDYFNSMYQGLVKDVGLEFIGILPVRGMTSVCCAENRAEQQLIDLVPTRAAQFALNYTENGNIHFVTLKTEIGRTESYPDRFAEGWGFMGCNNIHYNQLGYNALGKDAAENAVAMFNGKSDRTATELRLLNKDGRASLNDGDTITLRVGEKRQISALILPLYAEDTTLTFKVADESICTVDAFGMLTASTNVNSDGKSTTVTITNGTLTKTLNVSITL